MTTTMKKYITGVLALLSCSLLFAQEPTQEAVVPSLKNYYTYDYLLRSNFWLQGNNAAGLVFNDKALELADAYSQIDGTIAYNDGPFRNIYTSESEQQYKLNALSYLKFDKIYLYGNFTYDYNFRKEVKWNGLLYPTSSPFMLADSIPGNQAIERFSFDAGIALPINKYFSAGVYMDYTVASAAKQKDLRNKNTYMNLLLRPGINFRSPHWNLGASFTFERTTEKIEYSQYESGTAKSIFSLSGLWFYTYDTFSSSENRRKLDDRIGGSFQVEFITGDFKYYSEFSGFYREGTFSETGYNNQQYGDTEAAAFRYDGKISYANQFYLTGYIDVSTMLGYKVIQRSERDPNAGVSIWITYDRANIYVQNKTEYGLAYTRAKPRTEYNNSYDFTIGMKGYNMESAFKLYPLKYVQRVEYREAYLMFNENFSWKSGMLDINPGLAYGMGSGTMNDRKIMNTMAATEVDEFISALQTWQLEPELAAEFAFMTSDRLNMGVHCRYTYFLSKSKGYNLYGDFRYNYVRALSDLLKDKHRSYFSLTVGFSF